MSPYVDEAASIARLVEIFSDICLEQYDTYMTGDVDYRNRLFRVLVLVKDELNARGPEARRSLLRLLSHPDPQVRLQAAKFVYPVAREEAKKCLQDLAAARLPDQSLDAGMTLRRLEEVPDCLDH
jgi:hypothetical protein